MATISASYIECPVCGAYMKPIWFLEEEYVTHAGLTYKSGRVREAVSVLVCPDCLTEEPVDDSFDRPWHNPTPEEKMALKRQRY